MESLVSGKGLGKFGHSLLKGFFIYFYGFGVDAGGLRFLGVGFYL